jgi:pyruvate dehydrogenase E1 component alpha subunit
MEPDDQAYVDKAELAAWKKKDPIAALEARLLGRDVLSERELAAMKESVRARVEDAAAFALQSPWPSFDQLTTDVYA